MIWGHTGTGVLKACEQEKLLSMKVFFAMASPALFLWHFCCQFNRVFKSPDPESKIRVNQSGRSSPVEPKRTGAH